MRNCRGRPQREQRCSDVSLENPQWLQTMASSSQLTTGPPLLFQVADLPVNGLREKPAPEKIADAFAGNTQLRALRNARAG
jgi:hypothetical protein